MIAWWIHHRSVTRVRLAGLFFIAVAFTGWGAGSPAAIGQTETQPWYGVVEAQTVAVHAGRAPEYDRLALLKKGDVVQVRHVNSFGWASIAPMPGLTAFVRQQEVAQGSTPGTIRAIGRVPVYYPISDDPVQCFRKYRVDPDTVMHVLDTIQTTDRGVYYKVQMPEQMDVYALAEDIRKATDVEVKAWQQKVEAGPIDAPIEKEPVKDQATAPVENTDIADPDREAQVVNLEIAPVEDEEARTQEIIDAITESLPETARTTATQTTPQDKPKPQGVTLAELEMTYDRYREIPIADLELEPLIAQYESFANLESTHPAEAKVARFRIELLKIRQENQAALAALEQARVEAQKPGSTENLGRLVDVSGRPVYVATGILQPSKVFDGGRLPLLYRVQDPITGRTIAYLDPGSEEERIAIERLLGTQVGVSGELERKAQWNIQLVADWEVDDLTGQASADEP